MEPAALEGWISYRFRFGGTLSSPMFVPYGQATWSSRLGGEGS